MTIRSENTSVSRFRSLVARLHPSSVVRFVLENPDGTYVDLALTMSDFHQSSELKAGFEVPDGPPNATFFLRATARPVPSDGMALKILERPPPNSGDPG